MCFLSRNQELPLQTKMRYLPLIFIILFSCKKKDDNSPTPQPTPPNNQLLGDMGVFASSYNVVELVNGFSYTDSTQDATFFDTPYAGKSYIYAGTVSVNGDTLLMSNSPYVYYNINKVAMSPMIWAVSGSGTVAPMNFSYTPNYPQFQENNQLPDTVIKSNGITFTINSVTAVNKPVIVTINQGTSPISRTLTSFPATVSVTPAEISGFVQELSFIIKLSCFNYSNVTLNGNQYAINANRMYQKYCYLK